MMTDTTGNGNSATRFIEKLGQHFEAEGMSRIAGRILGYLLLQREARTLDEIADALRVSKASVSSNTRMLETAGALERVTRTGDRRDYYLVGDVSQPMVERRMKWLRGTVQLLGEGCQTEPARDAVVGSRLTNMKEFFEHMIESMSAFQESWARTHGEVER